jgi:hypothetical protein
MKYLGLDVANFNYFYSEKWRKKSQEIRVFSHFPEEKIRQDKKIHQKKKKLVQKSFRIFICF